MTAEGSEEPHPSPGSVYESDQEVIEEAVRMLRELNDTPLHQMTPLFYQHGYEELRMMVRDLLRMLCRDPPRGRGNLGRGQGVERPIADVM